MENAMTSPKALILAGDGINCERETARSFAQAGAKTKIMLLNQVAARPSVVKDFQIFAFPGGFSFGDELGSGRIFALKIKYLLREMLETITLQDKLALGVCNGLQALTQLGLIPNTNSPRNVTLTFNTQAAFRGSFINRWVKLQVAPSRCIWTRDMENETISLPIRHGEGRVKLFPGREREIYRELQTQGQIPLHYEEDINGSFEKIAGLCDPTGRLFGLMPHPEAATERRLRPGFFGQGPGPGIRFFENAVQYFR